MRIQLFLSFMLIFPIRAMERIKKNKQTSTASCLQDKSIKTASKSLPRRLIQIKKKSWSVKKASSKADSYDADTEESEVLE